MFGPFEYLPHYLPPPSEKPFHRYRYQPYQRKRPFFCLCIPSRFGLPLLLLIWIITSFFFAIYSFLNKSAFFSTVPNRIMLNVFGTLNLLSALTCFYGFYVVYHKQRQSGINKYQRYVKITAVFNSMVIIDAAINCILFGIDKDDFVQQCEVSAAANIMLHFSQNNITSVVVEEIMTKSSNLFNCSQLFEIELGWSIGLLTVIAIFYVWWTIFLFRDLRYHFMEPQKMIGVPPAMAPYLYNSVLFRSPMVETPNLGGGPAGLAAARALRNENAFATITIFERNEHNGGTWYYTPETNDAPPFPSTNALEVDRTLQADRVNSPMYAHLHTNLPKSVMCFQDFPFSTETPDFPSHKDVFQYLESMAVKEDLKSYVRFSTMVEKVECKNNAWYVSVATTNNDNKKYTEKFDAVVVATGHYSVPYIPDFPGLDKLNENKRIQLLHSRDYREPTIYKDKDKNSLTYLKTILVIGGGSSAIDIARELSTVGRKVYQSIRTETELYRQTKPKDVIRVNQVERFVHDDETNTSCIELANGDILTGIDLVIFGTGYLYSFPFLPFQKDNLIKTGQKVFHLDHYMFYHQDPSLCFLGLPIRIVPFPLIQRQAIVMARYWCKKIPMLPYSISKKDDLADDDREERADFILGLEKEFDYNHRLGAWAEGWVEKNIDGWQSTNRLTGRLSEQWKENRKNALLLRKQYLGY
ncbi:hypothetical protein BDF20DRAFT_984386 [Mycotypha africana]|uniref:uncharacterized protein n=1 Tax=Mycotypha africana TaxID=64632 RepID=UPI002301F2B0|nr:uncharacterized protein BDF20DRAFT_984386 [Mycotypha africana]KAI8991779.1 hypothetical protein BDF20DRAFT_984386 [Mycotypha africana]